MPSKPLKYNGGYIRPRENGTVLAEVNHGYKRLRKVLPNPSQARTWIDAQKAAIDRQVAPLDPWKLRDAQQAAAILPKGVTLYQAAQYYVDNNTIPDPVRMSEAIAQYLEDKARHNLRKRSLQTLRHHLRALADIPTALTDAKTLSEILDALELAPKTRNNYIADWRSFFNWLMKRGMVKTNPALSLEKSRQDETAPGVLTPEDTERILRAAQREFPKMLPWLPIGFFAGVRSAEILRLSRDDIKPGHIEIGATVAKIRARRIVTINPTLGAWIKKHPPEEKPIRGNWYKRKTDLKNAAEVDHWPANAARHSFASYHLALYQDGPRLAHELGHQSLTMLYRHYRAVATPADARKYFAILP